MPAPSTRGAGPENDPVAAYDRIAPFFNRISGQRKAYLDSVERIIVQSAPPASKSLLDVGSGDGSRARRIALTLNLPTLVMAEPSEEMIGQSLGPGEIWIARAESLGGEDASFDVITCLWNVLGHIFPAANRIKALARCATLIKPAGRIFIDVSHRYNARHYGYRATSLRMLKDYLQPGENNGDVTVTWNFDGTPCRAAGHVFTHKEFKRLCDAAGLVIEKRITVDYATGEIQSWSFTGNLLYALKRAS